MSGPFQGEVYYLYAFDVADEIRTEHISKILAKKASPFQISPEKTFPRTFPFYRPLSIQLKRESWTFKERNIQPLVRIYEVGVVSLIISVPFEVEALKQLNEYHEPVLDNGTSMEKASLGMCRDVVKNLEGFLMQAIGKIHVPEAYTVFTFSQLGDSQPVEEWARNHQREIIGLLDDWDPAELAEQQISEVFRQAISFSSKDITIIDWDAAFVVNTAQGVEDVIHVLELANLQLEEMVLMDKRLDNYLDQAYDLLEKKRTPLLGFPRSIAGKLRRFRMDVAKITDEVSNISKYIGEWHLARVYLAAKERFHIKRWQDSIQERLNSLDHLYEIFRSEVADSRMLLLEFLIVLLFIIDLVVIIFQD